ncbi:MAG: NAD(P)/FAD-dependent oxidoreductase [Alphaproteobacteria bacterium]|nr:NAD(P)/FAD-dependent oxidoreductase [Alphaproteobacteria bacterium]
MKHVIVGTGPAGVVAAETLRKASPEAEITMFSGEPDPPYGRMALPYFLVGNIDEAGTYLRKTKGHFEGLDILVRVGRVAGVSPDAHEITLIGGETETFDRLLIATGAVPVKPPVDGLDLPGVHHCWSLEDARNIIERAEEGSSVVLIGAGFIACIILQSLIERGVKLTVIEREPRMVSHMMDDVAGDMLKRWCEAKGVIIRTATQVSRIEDAGDGALTVHLDNGDPVDAALVVVATGARSNVGFLDDSGIKVEEGVVVDEYLKSSVDDVYAAGDAAQGPDWHGGWAVHGIQPTAADHGRIAGLNMAGGNVRFQGSLSMNVLDTAGLISTSFGRWQGVDGGDFAQSVNEKDSRYIRLAFEEDRLIGALTLGRTDHVGVLRGLIQTPVHLGEWKAKLMEDPHRIMEAYLAKAAG